VKGGLSRAVTIAVFILVGGGVVWFVKSRVTRPTVGQRFTTFAMFRDGSGLPIGSQVVIAGVRVGEIHELSVEHGMARIGMRLRDDTVVYDDAWAAKRASSLLGDSYIEILPGGPAEDDPPGATHRRLASGEQIPHVLEAGSTERVLRQIQNAMPRIDSAMASAQKALLQTRRWISGPFAEGFADADEYLERGAIAGPIESAAAAMNGFNEWTITMAQSTEGLADQVNPQLERLADGIVDANTAIASAQVSIHESLATARTRMDDIDPYLARAQAALAEYVGDDPDQQGALARLITEDELGETLDDGTTSAKSFTDSLGQAISWMGIRGEYNILSGTPRLYVIAEINARNDKFYLIELEKGGLGGMPHTTLTDEPGSDVWTLRSDIRERIRFTAQVGKKFPLGGFGMARFRVGFKDSTVGAGADLDVFRTKLRLSADVFDATFAQAPRLKLSASVQIFKYIYLLAGVDDALNPGGNLPIAPWPPASDVPQYFEQVHYGRDYFVGGMLNITDADLAVMLRVYGAMIIGGMVN
jgi:phospholipid/cholesterol/gamma-HCH transport system substrate-binding protein